MPLATSGSQLSVKNPQESKLPNFVVEKLRNSEEPCPIEVQTKRFPVITGALRTNATKRKVHPCESTRDCIKSDVTLPRLKNIPQQRIDAGEPHSDCNFEENQPDYVNPEVLQWLSSSESRSEEDIVSWRQALLETLPSKAKSGDKIKDLNQKEELLEESHVLKRWQYWMNDKKRMLNYLSQRLERNPQDLMIQESDKYRKVVEEKLMYCHSRISEPDTWKGSPTRWKPELNITTKKTQVYFPTHCLIKAKPERGERREIEFVGLPNVIKAEKGHLGIRRREWDENKKTIWKEHSVKELKKTDSHEVETDELAVVGKRLSEKPKERTSVEDRDVPTIVQPNSAVEEKSENCLDERQSIFCLVIDGQEINYKVGSKCCQDPDRVFDWQVNFWVSAAGAITEKVLRVENRGTVAVRFDWLSPKTKKKPSWNALQPKHHKPWFFFNKNSGFFLPGQIYDLKFYFHARTSGIRKEIWRMKTDPPLSENVEFGTITLSGVATEEFSKNEKRLHSYLKKRVLESTISLIINTILYKTFIECECLSGIEYRSIFSEKELFEYHNPKYYYHSFIVSELHGFFNEVRLEVQSEWDLSLDSLIHVIKSHKTGNDRATTISQIALRARALLRPNYFSANSVKKYKMTHGILCKMANSMEEDYNYLRNVVSENIEAPNTSMEIGEAEVSTLNSDSITEEMGEWGYNGAIFQIKPTNFMFFKMLLYLKVYRRVCEAAEHIAGVLETRKLFEPWKEVNYKPAKPPRTGSVFMIPQYMEDVKGGSTRNAECQTKILGQRN